MSDEGTDVSNNSLIIFYAKFQENYEPQLKFLDILEIKDKSAEGTK